MGIYPPPPRPVITLIGDPVRYTLLPRLQGALLARLGLNYAYKTLRVPADALKIWLNTARGSLVGFNADEPHKATLVPLLDTLSADADACRCVDTVLVRETRLHGHCTSGAACLRALEAAGFDSKNRQITLLGGGNMARAIALKLLAHGAQSVTLCCQSKEAGETAASLAGALGAVGTLRLTGLAMNELQTAFAGCDLLLNALPEPPELGQIAPETLPLEVLPAAAAVQDLTYLPQETALLRAAAKLGHVTFDGLAVLIQQSILDLELFTDTRIDAAQQAPALLRLLTR